MLDGYLKRKAWEASMVAMASRGQDPRQERRQGQSVISAPAMLEQMGVQP